MIKQYKKIAIINKNLKLNLEANGSNLIDYKIDFSNINFVPKIILIKFNADDLTSEGVCLGWISNEELKNIWDSVLLKYPERNIGGDVKITLKEKASKYLKVDINFSYGVRMYDVILDKIILIE